MQHEVKFYTKEGCHLCDDAREMLARLATQFPLSIESVDIMLDPEVYERFKYTIPVIEIDGDVKLGGRFTENDLRDAIAEALRVLK